MRAAAAGGGGWSTGCAALAAPAGLGDVHERCFRRRAGAPGEPLRAQRVLKLQRAAAAPGATHVLVVMASQHRGGAGQLLRQAAAGGQQAARCTACCQHGGCSTVSEFGNVAVRPAGSCWAPSRRPMRRRRGRGPTLAPNARTAADPRISSCPELLGRQLHARRDGPSKLAPGFSLALPRPAFSQSPGNPWPIP